MTKKGKEKEERMIRIMYLQIQSKVKNSHLFCVFFYAHINVPSISPLLPGYGISTDGERTYINCAACNASYRPVQDPIVFDYVLPEPYSREDFDLLSPQELTVIKPWQS